MLTLSTRGIVCNSSGVSAEPHPCQPWELCLRLPDLTDSQYDSFSKGGFHCLDVCACCKVTCVDGQAAFDASTDCTSVHADCCSCS